MSQNLADWREVSIGSVNELVISGRWSVIRANVDPDLHVCRHGVTRPQWVRDTCYCQWTSIIFSTAIFSTENLRVAEDKSHLVWILTENELSHNHVKKIVVCSKNCDNIGYQQWLRTSHMKAINMKNTNVAVRQWTEVCRIVMRKLFQASSEVRVCQYVDKYDLLLNSLRPSDAYMLQWTNQHWFR